MICILLSNQTHTPLTSPFFLIFYQYLFSSNPVSSFSLYWSWLRIIFWLCCGNKCMSCIWYNCSQCDNVFKMCGYKDSRFIESMIISFYVLIKRLCERLSSSFDGISFPAIFRGKLGVSGSEYDREQRFASNISNSIWSKYDLSFFSKIGFADH